MLISGLKAMVLGEFVIVTYSNYITSGGKSKELRMSFDFFAGYG
ncbi:MAG: hypothetical protein WC788_04690 [Candidatus Paceibacterota bacterium]